MRTHLPYQSKTDLVADALKRMIDSGDLMPGARLRQRDVAELLGVSSTPVREAFRRLEGEGFIVTESHRASVVVRSEDSRLYENAQIRAALEGLGASLAASRATPETIGELDELNRLVAQSTDPEMARAANRRFHFRIYELAGSPALLAQLSLLWRTLDGGPQMRRSLAESVVQHHAIIEALKSGDGDRALSLTRHHILEAHQGMAPGSEP